MDTNNNNPQLPKLYINPRFKEDVLPKFVDTHVVKTVGFTRTLGAIGGGDQEDGMPSVTLNIHHPSVLRSDLCDVIQEIKGQDLKATRNKLIDNYESFRVQKSKAFMAALKSQNLIPDDGQVYFVANSGVINSSRSLLITWL